MISRECIFDWCAFGNTTIGFVLGILASSIAAFGAAKIRRLGWRRRLTRLEGVYTGFVFQKDSNGNATSELDRSTSSSKATIAHQGDDLVSIRVEELKRTDLRGEHFAWDGQMNIVIAGPKEFYGRIAFHYSVFTEGQYQFGFKRCMFLEDSEDILLLLIGEDGFGKEVFFKNRV